MTTSLATLKTMILQAADMENSSFIDTEAGGELERLAQDSYRELYDLLVTKFEDYYVSDPTVFTLTGGAGDGQRTALAATFYKLIGVDLLVSGSSTDGDWDELDPFNFNERNDRSSGNGMRQEQRYRLIGGYLYINPADGAAGTYRYWWVPECPTLSASVGLDASCERYRDYVVLDAAIKCLTKEESDTTTLERRLGKVTARIETAAAGRDAGRSARITDVRRGLVNRDRREF